jgi:hypothetical protein
MKRIALTQGQYALVDDEDYERLNQVKWYAHENYKTFYAQRTISTINGRRRIIHMHHEVIGIPPREFISDHKNGNGLDNQRHNLRHVTHRQNGQNRKNQKKTSQYPGVSWHSGRKKWVAQIQLYGKIKNLGGFTNEVDAFNAYKETIKAIGEKVVGEIN